MTQRIGRVGIVGAGQVGSMLGLALRSAPGVDHVLLADRNEDTARVSAGMGAGDVAATEEVLESDAVILALPVPEILRFLEERGAKLRDGSLVLDTGSVKRPVLEAMRRHVSEDVHAVGGHPMAGTEQQGPEGARLGLLRGATFVLTTVRDDPEGLTRATELVEAVGARAVEMDAALHDRVVARTSHLPHLVAAAVALTAEKQPAGAARDLAASGYAGLTRLAASDPEMVAGFLDANRDEVLDALHEVRDVLDVVEGAIDEGDGVLREFLEEAARARAEVLG
jgi:prephenate dehydrogenase